MQSNAIQFFEHYSSALIADAAFRAGVEVQVAPAAIDLLVRSQSGKLAGPVRTVAANNDLVAILGALARAAEGEVLVIGNSGGEAALIGDLIGLEAKRKRVGGFVIDGMVRDLPILRQLGVPVFARGSTPVGPLKLDKSLRGIGAIDAPVRIGQAQVESGMWAFGDEDGVIFLAANVLGAVYATAQYSQQREQLLIDGINQGGALGDMLQIERFLAERAGDDEADFNAHLQRIGRAI